MLSIVLKRQDLRESDQFITLFTDESGKREVLARGIKKITSKLSAYVLPFFILETECVPAKEMDLLITAQPYQTFRTIPQDFEKMSVVSYCLALVDSLTVLKHPEPRIFSLLASFLQACDEPIKNSEILVASFSVKLLALLGWQPELTTCLVCREVLGEEAGYFNIAEGGVVHAACRKPGQTVAGNSLVVPLGANEKKDFQKILAAPWAELPATVAPSVLELVHLFLLYHFQGKNPPKRFTLSV